jgi:hypothetical protein
VKAAVLALTLVVCAGATAAAATSALVPGDRIGGMEVAKLGWSEHVVSIFPACDPLITRPGFYHRTCIVPRFRRLFIGYGDFRTTLPALDRAWRGEQWQLYVDGREIYLPAFGTDWRIIVGFAGAPNRNTVFREWQVALVRPTPGPHTIRYIAIRRDGVVDVTFTVRVA